MGDKEHCSMLVDMSKIKECLTLVCADRIELSWQASGLLRVVILLVINSQAAE